MSTLLQPSDLSAHVSYMFYFKYAGTGPGVIVEKPTTIRDDELLFHFLVGYKSEGEWVKREDILAMGSPEGTVEVVGWSGKYIVLNQDLFNKYLQEGIVELKK